MCEVRNPEVVSAVLKMKYKLELALNSPLRIAWDRSQGSVQIQMSVEPCSQLALPYSVSLAALTLPTSSKRIRLNCVGRLAGLTISAGLNYGECNGQEKFTSLLCFGIGLLLSLENRDAICIAQTLPGIGCVGPQRGHTCCECVPQFQEISLVYIKS